MLKIIFTFYYPAKNESFPFKGLKIKLVWLKVYIKSRLSPFFNAVTPLKAAKKHPLFSGPFRSLKCPEL